MYTGGSCVPLTRVIICSISTKYIYYSIKIPFVVLPIFFFPLRTSVSSMIISTISCKILYPVLRFHGCALSPLFLGPFFLSPFHIFITTFGNGFRNVDFSHFYPISLKKLFANNFIFLSFSYGKSAEYHHHPVSNNFIVCALMLINCNKLF